MWSSDADDEFAEDFPDELIEANDRDRIDDLIEWLTESDYLPPGVPVTVVEDDSAVTGNFEALDDDDDDEDDEDDEAEAE
ncbi:MAG: hypothetical protein ACYDDA_03760 [Acidiferrobacteraceae bacterium]